jgi:hypothetical protein
MAFMPFKFYVIFFLFWGILYGARQVLALRTRK